MYERSEYISLLYEIQELGNTYRKLDNMKNLLRKLEKSKFITNIHRQALIAETASYIDSLNSHLDKLTIIKFFRLDPETCNFMDMRVKSLIMLSGLFDYFTPLIEDSKNELMLSAKLDGDFTVVAFKDLQAVPEITSLMFSKLSTVPVHLTSMDLDYKTTIYILFYDNQFELPGYNLN